MKLIRRAPYVMLSAMFVSGGIDAALRPKGKAAKAEALTEPVTDAVADTLGVGIDGEQLVRLNGVVQIVAGLMLAGGIFPRLAAIALAGSLVPTTLAGHQFWTEEDPQVRAGQRIHFLKNVSMLGGLLIVATTPTPARIKHGPTKD